MAMVIAVLPNLKVKIVARQPVKHGTMVCAELLARPRHQSLVPSILTRGAVPLATLVALPSGSAASVERVATEQLIAQTVNHHLRLETIAGRVIMHVVKKEEPFIHHQMVVHTIFVVFQEELLL